ncbi:MAG: preprotein translocase subunit SecE [Lachnospiraceae bacterium]|nr:preprotein translocase subunit SecE [Candidatus Merdinaster equi]
MAESTNKEKKVPFFKGVKSEFHKVSWPDKSTLIKESIAVVCGTIVLGAIIAGLDGLLQIGIKFLTQIG